jgi:RNA recognition motif-containing protein
MAMADRKVFVGNLPPTSFTNKNLTDFFAKFGAVDDAFVIRDAVTNVGRRCGIVTFKSVDTAEKVTSFFTSCIMSSKNRITIVFFNICYQGCPLLPL